MGCAAQTRPPARGASPSSCQKTPLTQTATPGCANPGAPTSPTRGGRGGTAGGTELPLGTGCRGGNGVKSRGRDLRRQRRRRAMGKRGCGKEKRRGEETAVAYRVRIFSPSAERSTEAPPRHTLGPDTTAAPPLLPAPGCASSTHPAPGSSPARPGQRRAAGTQGWHRGEQTPSAGPGVLRSSPCHQHLPGCVLQPKTCRQQSEGVLGLRGGLCSSCSPRRGMDAVGVSPQPDPQHGTHQEPGARVRLLAAREVLFWESLGKIEIISNVLVGELVAVSRCALLARGSSGGISVVPSCAVWHGGVSIHFIIIIFAFIFKPKPPQP